MEDEIKKKSYVDILLNRLAPEEYIQEWTEILKNEKEKANEEVTSILIFRLGVELFALPTVNFKEVLKLKKIHPLPHQKNPHFQGVISLNGELQPCISLYSLLQVDLTHYENKKKIILAERMIALSKDSLTWVFPVEEIKGISLLNKSQIGKAPVSIAKLKFSYVKGIFKLDDNLVSLIDEDLLFYSLKNLSFEFF